MEGLGADLIGRYFSAESSRLDMTRMPMTPNIRAQRPAEPIRYSALLGGYAAPSVDALFRQYVQRADFLFVVTGSSTGSKMPRALVRGCHVRSFSEAGLEGGRTLTGISSLASIAIMA